MKNSIEVIDDPNFDKALKTREKLNITNLTARWMSWFMSEWDQTVSDIKKRSR